MQISPQLWPRVSQLFDEGCEISGAARSAWLARLAVTDPGCAAAVRELLRASDEAPGARELRATSLDGLRWSALDAAARGHGLAAGDRLGPYSLVKLLGEGGMASVWEAEQTAGVLRRVALKVLHGRLETGSAEWRRFAQERDLLAGLEHPHIARLYDAGVIAAGEGLSVAYLAMELISGEPVTVHCQARGLNVQQRLALFDQVLAAVGHAHARLVVHGDLKPGNILVTPSGHVSLLDFGIARLLGEGSSGEARSFTPETASPEQLAGQPLSTASDVYSLGVVLYELLTGQRPYCIDLQAADLPAQVRAAQIAPPSRAGADAARFGMRPRRLQRALAGDLDAIVARALQPDPAARYAGVGELADELRRHRSHRPVVARRGGAVYCARRFAQRHRWLLTGTAAVALALGGGLAVATTQAREARLQRDAALERQRVGQALQAFAGEMMGMAGPDGQALSAEQVVDHAERVARRAYAQQPEVLAEVLLLIGGKNTSLQRPDARQRAYEDGMRLAAASVPGSALHWQLQCRAVALDADDAAARLVALSAGVPRAPAYALARYDCHSYAATLLAWQGRGDAAEAHAQASEDALAGQPQARAVLPDVHETRADVARSRGQLALADGHYRQAVEALHDSGRASTLRSAVLLNYRAVMHLGMGRPLQALGFSEQAQGVLAGMSAGAAMPGYMHANMGTALLQLGRLDEAEASLVRAVQRARQTASARYLFNAQGRLAELWLLRGRTADAASLLAERDRSPLAAGDAGLAASAALGTARLALARGLPVEAAARLQQVLPSLQANPFQRAQLVEAQLLLGQAALARGDRPAAREAALRVQALVLALVQVPSGPQPQPQPQPTAEAEAEAGLMGRRAVFEPSLQAGRAAQLLALSVGPGAQADPALAARAHAEAARHYAATLGSGHESTRGAQAAAAATAAAQAAAASSPAPR